MIVYRYTNKINGKVYIGITTRDLETRHKEHLKFINGDDAFHRALKKHGVNNFKLEVIDGAVSYEELKEKEIFHINEHNSFIHSVNSNGYNLTKGGDGTFGYKHNDKTKEKLREQKNKFYKNNKPYNFGLKLSKETKEKISKANKGRLKGNKNPFYGKTHSLETKKKLGELSKRRSEQGKHGRLGKKLSDETKKLIGSYHKGKIISEEQKKKQSEMFSGDNHPNALKVLCVTTNEIFNFMGEASEKYNLDRSNLTKCCKGRTKWCGIHPITKEKLQWSYYED